MPIGLRVGQIEDSIGSSVNDTNIEISTALTTVRPNWWKSGR